MGVNTGTTCIAGLLIVDIYICIYIHIHKCLLQKFIFNSQIHLKLVMGVLLIVLSIICWDRATQQITMLAHNDEVIMSEIFCYPNLESVAFRLLT